MHNDDLGPSMVQTTVLLHATLRTASGWHTCTRVHPPPQSLPPGCLSSQVHSEANSGQGPGLAIGVTNRNETAFPPSSQVREDPVGANTSSFGAGTIVPEKTKMVLWPSAALPRPLLGGCLHTSPIPKGSQSRFCEC